jgi:integrase
VIDKSERERFWAEYRELPIKARARLGLVMFTGARAGEVDAILVSDISFETGTVRRRIFKKAGGAQERVVHVPQSLLDDLRAWIDKAELGADSTLFKPNCQAGVKFLRRWRTSMRGLRRTVLTRLQDGGASLRVIQQVAGHSNLATTQRYLNVGDAAVQEALSSVSWGQQGLRVATDLVPPAPQDRQSG